MTMEEMRAALGVESEPAVHEVERGSIRRFADAVGDPNPLYRDPDAARDAGYGGVIAPPTYLRALMPDPALPPYPRPYAEVLDGGSAWRYFRPVQAGQRISVTWKLADAKEREGRLGPMVIATTELAYRAEDGALAATQRSTLIHYEPAPQPSGGEATKHEGPATGDVAWQAVTDTAPAVFEDAQVGQALPPLEKTPTTKQLVMYAGASGDFYEVHYDLAFARQRGLSNVIVHGALKNAFLAQMLTDWAGAGSIEELSVRYAGMDEPGAPLRCMGKITDKKEALADQGPPPPSFPRKREPIPGGVHHHDSGNASLRGSSKSGGGFWAGGLVSCDIWIEDAAGAVTTSGSAVVRLPGRES